MENHCANCSSRLTKSAIGELCLNCGHVKNYRVDSEAISNTHAHVATIAEPEIVEPETKNSSLSALVVPRIDHEAAAEPKPAKAKISPQDTLKKSTRVSLNAAIVVGVLTVILASSYASSQANESTPDRQANSLTAGVSGTTISADPQLKKRDSQRKNDLSEVSTALAVYHDQLHSYPKGASMDALNALLFANPPFLSHIPTDPLSSADASRYRYQYGSDGASFVLSAQLEDLTDPQTDGGIYKVNN